MDIQTFINNYREAFGEKTPLPVLFYYSDDPIAQTEKINGCFFKGMASVREGQPISLNAEVIGCGGGKLYTGYAPMNDFIPGFVSHKEKYKQTPQQVVDYVESLGLQSFTGKWLNFVRIDQAETFDGMEGLLFFATPDMLAGLTTWAFFDNDCEDAVSTIFGSGCSAVVSQAVKENRRGGKRTFLGLFDPSVRPYVGINELSFVIPASRFASMKGTMRECCLFDTHAWAKVKARINEGGIEMKGETTETDVWEILTWAEKYGIRLRLDGGWGVDALIGKATRKHNDVDLFVEEEQAEAFILLIHHLGFEEVKTPFSTQGHSVWTDKRKRIIDLHRFCQTDNGELMYEGKTYPADTFSAVGYIGGKAIPCVPPKQQVAFHLGYEHDENDRHDVLLLCHEFGIPIPEEYRNGVEESR